MDKEYLCQYDAIEVDSAIEAQKPFGEVKFVTEKYPIASDESEEDNTYFAYTKVVGSIMDITLCQAMAMLDYALVSAPGAPVRQALIDAGIGQDVYGSFDEGLYQPTYTIYAKNAHACDKERFVEIIESTLRKVVEEGVNQTSILAAINSADFRFREADYGHYPKGLLYGLACMDGWLFDDMEVFTHLELLDIYEYLRKQVGTSYYEDLIKEYLLDNTHGAVIALEPEKGLNQKTEEALEAKLAAYKATLSEEELERLIADTKHLEEYQEEPSPEEDLLKLPMLKREDMRKEVLPLSNIEEEIGDVKVVRHDVFTNGIDYVSFLFDAEDIEAEDIPYMGFLRNVLAFVDTESYSFSELTNEINIHSGGISTGMGVYPDSKVKDKYHIKYEFRLKVLEHELENALGLIKEIILTSKIDDVKRLTEIVAQTKSRLQSVLSSSGHVVSATRSMAYFSQYAYFQDATTGIAYYDEVCKMDAQMKENPEIVIDRLRKVMNLMFGRSRLMMSYTNLEDSYKKAVPALEKFIQSLPEGAQKGESTRLVLGKRNEAFTDASAIQYVSRSGNFVEEGFAYNGALNILKMILNYDYLWMNIRVKGGAYGCMSSFLRTGESYFTSYRDPNLRKTNEVYEGIPEYLREFTADEREMTKYIIGTLGGMDTPLYPEGKGHRSMTAYLKDLNIEELQRERDEILNATDADIRALADLIEAVLKGQNFCVLGNETNIRKEEDMFLNIRSLNE